MGHRYTDDGVIGSRILCSAVCLPRYRDTVYTTVVMETQQAGQSVDYLDFNMSVAESLSRLTTTPNNKNRDFPQGISAMKQRSTIPPAWAPQGQILMGGIFRGRWARWIQITESESELTRVA